MTIEWSDELSFNSAEEGKQTNVIQQEIFKYKQTLFEEI